MALDYDNSVRRMLILINYHSDMMKMYLHILRIHPVSDVIYHTFVF